MFTTIPVARRSSTPARPAAARSMVGAIAAGGLRSPGRALPAQDQRYFGKRFGFDFSQVRVHDDAAAADAASGLGAEAFTVGRDVVFGAGRYAPQRPEGRRLLAHELVHVTQQDGSTGGEPAPRSLDMSQPQDAAEIEAERVSAVIDEPGAARPSLRTRPLVQRAVTKGCIAPSFVVTPFVASAFGTVAEAMIDADYLGKLGGTPFGDVFFDNPLGPMSYVAFLAAHHPSLDVPLLALQIGLSGGVLVPDILDTRDPEFYDVKPDSPDGRLAGRAKLAAIDAFMSFNSLPYVRGSRYTPTPSIPIPLAGAMLAAVGLDIIQVLACGLPVVTLEPRLLASGLIVYEVCIQADFECYLKIMALELLIALIIIAILIARGVPVPVPPIPAPLPAPVPVPVPVPPVPVPVPA